jgi:hypothetical protein
MYFPRNLSEFVILLEGISEIPNDEKIRILDGILNQGEKFVNSEIKNLLIQYKKSLIKQEEIGEDLREENHYLKKELQQELENNRCLELKLREAIRENENICSSIGPTKKAYKNLYIYLLCHPRNNATVVAEILSRMNFLDKMTRDVTFIMPGYKRAQADDKVVNESDPNLQLTFDENLFIDVIQELEDKSDGIFLYTDACELVVVGIKQKNEYDFENFCRLDLHLLSQIRGIDPVKLILTVSQQFRKDQNNIIEVKKYVNQILGELTVQYTPPTIKVFIAGAKILREERALFREELCKVENACNLDIRSLTFEDFPTYLTGGEKGRQADYNKFIRNEANVVIFVFDATAGEITEEEFDIAYNSLKENKHPNIFVYVNKRTYNKIVDRRLENIINKIFAYQKEYYIEYENLDNLRYLFYRDMMDYFKNKRS